MNLRYSIDWMRHAVLVEAEDLLTGTELNLAAFEMSTVPMIFQEGRGLVDFSRVIDVSARTDDLVFFLISLNKLARSRVAVVIPIGMAPDPITEALKVAGVRHIKSFQGEVDALGWLNEGVPTERQLLAKPKQAPSVFEATE